MRSYLQGRYNPINPSKYIGDKTNIVYRSRWERLFFKYLDTNPNIIQWGSEVIIVPYICATDKRQHRYFVDIIYKTISNEVFLIEVKPYHETQKPNFKKSTKKKTIVESSNKYLKNMSKWAAATKYAEDRGWKFKIFTEDTLRKLGLKV